MIALVALGAGGTTADAAPWPPLAPATATGSTAVTENQALATAEVTGQQVPVTSATTETETLTANPDGHLTLTRTAMPVRRLVGGAWKDLDATLQHHPDGSISPAVASSDLALSDGGSGPLATLAGNDHRLALTMPMALPDPTLSGPTATYHDVLPDVDVVATATEQGGFSEVVVVRSPAAAADPRLATLKLATQATGMTLASDASGNISGVDRLGRVVVSAPAPQMWDSSTASSGATAAAKARSAAADSDPALPAASSADGPGADAQHATLGVQVSGSAITLTPDSTLMKSPGLSYPVYLDPSFVQPVVSDKYSGWSTINKSYASTKYWNSTPDPHPAKDMQVGTPDESDFISRSLINFPIEVAKFGAAANISKATLQINEDWAYSCSARTVNLYAPSQTLTSSNASWNGWSSAALGSVVDSANVAYGYDGCAAHNVAFDVINTVKADITTPKTTQTFLLKAADESDKFSWKEFTHPSSSVGPILTVDFNHAPTTPTTLKTNPASACGGGSAIGLGPVSLSATVSDADGGMVGATFKLTNHATGALVQTSDPQVTHATSGQSVSFTLDQSKLTSSAGGKVTTFDWTASATDYKATSGTATCHFNFDPTSPGAPTISPAPDGVTIGQPVSFTASPSGTDSPGAYLVQLNGTAPVRYPATGGVATFAVTPTRLADTLTVISVSSTGTNIGQPSDLVFNAVAATPAAGDDFTGDGVPDLLAVGGPGTPLPPGLWVGPGDKTRGIDPRPVEVGAYGDGKRGDQLPTDFNGARAITGAFDPQAGGLQDILVYQPQGAPLNEGGGEILDGNGDASPIIPTPATQSDIGAGTLDDQFDYPVPVAPQELVNAGNTSGRNDPYPDLIGIGGEATDGYSLWYYNGTFQPGSFDGPNPMLGLTTPTGGLDWNTWTLASAQISGTTDLYLWQKSTGALYLWSNLAYSADASTLNYTQTSLGTWNTGAAITLQAADIDGNGTPDLWTLGTGNTTTAWLDNGATLTATAAQTLTPPSHTWLLNDGQDGIATNARDLIGTNTAHATTGDASWHAGSLYNPDVTFDANQSGMNASPLVVGNTDFTVSFWARPTAYSGNIVSQDGNTGAYFKIWPSTDTTWHFGMQKTDGAFSDDAWDEAKSAANTDALGVWYHITATYQASTRKMSIYIGTTLAGTTTRTGNWPPPAESSTVKLQFGSMKVNSGWGYYYKGELANVQTWNAVVPPVA